MTELQQAGLSRVGSGRAGPRAGSREPFVAGVA